MKKKFYAMVLVSALALNACSVAARNADGQADTGDRETTDTQAVSIAESETEQGKAQTESVGDHTDAEEAQLISTQELDEHFKIGIKEGKIVLEAYDDGSYLLKVMDDEAVLSELEMNTVHQGNKDVYISLDEEQPYLLVYTPYVMQGDADLSYEILTWQEGTQKIAAQDSIQFRYALYTDADIPVADVAEYADKLSAYLENCKLLVSVNTEGIRTEETEQDSYSMFNRILPIADRAVYDELELEQSGSMEEKLVCLNKYFKEIYEYRNSEK